MSKMYNPPHPGEILADTTLGTMSTRERLCCCHI